MVHESGYRQDGGHYTHCEHTINKKDAESTPHGIFSASFLLYGTEIPLKHKAENHSTLYIESAAVQA